MVEIDIEYHAAHTFKNQFWRNFDKAARDVVIDSLVGLWSVRTHPHYYDYGNSEAVPLHEIIGFDVQGSELFKNSWYQFGYDRQRRDYSRTAPSPALAIPDVTETFTRGILTDVARETKRVVLDKLRQNEELCKYKSEEEEERNGYPSDPQKVIQGLDITVEKFIQIYADSHAYTTFLLGFYLPHIGESSGVAKVLKERNRLGDPVSYIRELISLEVAPNSTV